MRIGSHYGGSKRRRRCRDGQFPAPTAALIEAASPAQSAPPRHLGAASYTVALTPIATRTNDALAPTARAHKQPSRPFHRHSHAESLDLIDTTATYLSPPPSARWGRGIGADFEVLTRYRAVFIGPPYLPRNGVAVSPLRGQSLQPLLDQASTVHASNKHGKSLIAEYARVLGSVYNSRGVSISTSSAGCIPTRWSTSTR